MVVGFKGGGYGALAECGGLRSARWAGRRAVGRAAGVPTAWAALAELGRGDASARCATQPLRYTSEAPPKPHRMARWGVLGV